MGRAEGVVLALTAFGETRKPSTLTQRMHQRAPTGNDLVRITLVANIPDQLVLWRIEHRMERHRQFDHTQTRGRAG